MRLRYLSLVILMLVIASSSFVNGMRFRKIDMSSGLSYNSVMCVYEDSEGLLWVGTREGLNKYNSQDFTIFKHDFNDPGSLTNNHINTIYETLSGDLWIGTINGISKFNREDESFTNFLAPADSTELSNGYVKSIVEDGAGNLWVGTSNGLSIYSFSEDSFEHVYLASLPTFSNNIISLFRDRSGLIWVGTKGGLYVWEEEVFKKVTVDPVRENQSSLFEIRDVKQSADGRIWVATEDFGVYVFQYAEGRVDQKRHWSTRNSDLLSNQVRKVFVEDGKIWLATLKGLCIIDEVNEEILNFEYSIENPEGISRGSVHDVIRDRNGGYWVATYSGGLNYYHEQNNLFQHYKRSAGVSGGLIDNAINGFQEDSEGNIWVATGGGIDRFNPEARVFDRGMSVASDALSNNIIKALVADGQGGLWLGTYEGLNYFDIERNYVTKFFHAPGQNSLNQNQIHALHVDEEGLLWIGSNGGELQVYNPKTGLFEDVPGVGNIISVIHEDTRGRLWIGDRSGLKCVDRKSRLLIDISHIIRAVENELLFINWISEDTSGRIWIGTQSTGLFIIENDQLFWFGKDKGLEDNTVNAILEDENGLCWVSTNNGISALELSLDSTGSHQLYSINFTSIHGLQGPQFNPGSAYKDSTGKMYFGGINGFNVFSPDDIVKEDYYPPVVIDELHVNSTLLKPGSDKFVLYHPEINTSSAQLTLEYNERNIFLRFAGINYLNPEGTYYRYMVAGLDEGWNLIGHHRSINFTYLPVGVHELRLQASTNKNLWGNDYTLFTIKVLPPWWLTWWAYLLYLLIFMFLLYAFFSYSKKWADLKSRIEMERLIRQREQKMIESKIQFFTDVSHELRTPLTLILAPLEKIMMKTGRNQQLHQQLVLIQRNGARMMQMINQVLNLRKLEIGQHEILQASKGDLVLFLSEIALSFKELAVSKGVLFDCQAVPESLMVWFDSTKLEIVVYNLLSNAFKHTPQGGQVKISLSVKNDVLIKKKFSEKYRGEYVEIVISDNGKGIPAEQLEIIFDRFFSVNSKNGVNPTGVGIGLEVAKRMVEMHKGFIQVESEASTNEHAGLTRFSVFLPLGKHHLRPEEIAAEFNDGEDIIGYSCEIKPDEELDVVESLEGAVSFESVADSEKQTLLIVEDNSEVRSFIKDLFDDYYLVQEAENGLKGWQIASEQLPDLVISDVMMPEMDGMEFCRKLKTDVRTSHIPVILLTARASGTFKYEGFKTGADAYITKPFSAQFLILRVKNLIEQRNALRQHLQREALLDPDTFNITSVDDRLLKKAIDYIHQNIDNSSLSIEKLSQELGLSRMHFYRKIKSLTNLTPAEFVKNVRLKKAASLLQGTTLSVKEVQSMVGFENADHFRDCFKNQYNMTPRDYQKSEG